MTNRLSFNRYVLSTVLFASLLVMRWGGCAASEPVTEFPFKAGDRVQWIGSSSTRIATWCRTMEYMLRTRHPELHLVFGRSTTGGGTFLTGIKNLPVWLGEFKPTVVLYNYGGNDAAPGPKGIPQFKLNMLKTVEITENAGARVLFMTHQSGDVRLSMKLPFDNRKLYAEVMLEFAKENGWTMYDTHHPLEALQLDCQAEVPDFTINKDRIHLTDSAYVAWGFYLYDAMNPPAIESALELSADGKILHETNCKAFKVTAASPGVLEFTRADSVLPLLPPDPIPLGFTLRSIPSSAGAVLGNAVRESLRDSYRPGAVLYLIDGTSWEKLFNELAFSSAFIAPMSMYVKVPVLAQSKIPAAQASYALKNGQKLPFRNHVPLEKYSRYMLKVSGLDAGQYQVLCEGQPIGTLSHTDLAAGINLNTLLLDSKNPAPWSDFAKSLWLGKRLDEIGKTQWKFRIEKK